MNDSLIHLRVPAATKARWVRASRAEGMRLTDWITEAVEDRMQKQLAKIAISDPGVTTPSVTADRTA